MKRSRSLGLGSAFAAQGSTLIDTRCGPIEVQQAGAGIPLLMIHGSSGGHHADIRRRTERQQPPDRAPQL